MILSLTKSSKNKANTASTEGDIKIRKSKSEIFTSGGQSLYQAFCSQTNDKLTEIIKRTKGMLTNSSKFKSYISRYNSQTQIYSFKTPNITQYPVLNHSCKNIIPLKTTLFDYSKDKPKTIMTQKANFFIKNINTKKKFNGKLRLYKSRSLIDDNKGTVFNFANFFINELIYDWKYKNKIYDENEVFFRDEKNNVQINNFFQKKIKEIQNNIRIENKEIILEKHYNGKNEICLKLLPIKIIFTNITDPTKQKIILDIPFAFSFLFYCKKNLNLKKILLPLIKFSRSFDSISLNENEIYEFVKNSNVFKDLNNQSPKNKSNKSKNKTRSNIEFNVYKLLWYTPYYIYEVEISVPEICLNISKGNIYISMYIPSKLFLYLYKQNFEAWDFYALCYLLSFKKNRYLIEQFLSKKQKKFFFGFEYCKPPENSSKVKIFHGDNYSKLLFFYTNSKLSNFINKINSYKVSITYHKLNPNKSFEFDFSFKQMKMLYKISKYQKIETFISKLIITDFSKGNLELNYNVLDNLDYSIFKEKVENSNDVNTTDSSITNLNTSSQDVQIHIEYPNLEKIDYTGFSTIAHDYIKKIISHNIVEAFSNEKMSIENWGKLFLESQASSFSQTNSSKTRTASRGDLKINKRLFSVVETEGCHLKRMGTIGKLLKSPKKNH